MEDEVTRGTCSKCKHAAMGHHGIECRVAAPTVDYKSAYRRFPLMFAHDWCARFKEAGDE